MLNPRVKEGELPLPLPSPPSNLILERRKENKKNKRNIPATSTKEPP